MAKILVLFAHPAFEKSRVHRAMVGYASGIGEVSLHDLYEAYPDYDIDLYREQELLLQHDIIIFQHPFYWYSCPAIMKQWQDLVLAHGWAYGRGGTQLAGKFLMNAITAGGREEVYSETGYNRFTVRQLLAPFDQTANLCRMSYLPPFVIHDTHRMDAAAIDIAGKSYRRLLEGLANETIDFRNSTGRRYINELIPATPALNF